MWQVTGNLKGPQGDNGPSAYEIAVQEGFSGTQGEWLASLQGVKGDAGDTGPAGQSVTITTVTTQAAYDAATPGPLEIVVRTA